MKCTIPEISWHNRDPVLSVDIQVQKDSENFFRIATGGTDSHVCIWHLLRQEDGTIKLDCVCDLTRHQKAVNAVKFSPCGEYLASGDDESAIIIWKMKTDQDTPEITDEETSENREFWIQLKVLRGHLNDVYDLSWSLDSVHLLSGSVDNTAIIWDVARGKKTSIMNEAKNFVQGVSWDPENKYMATLSSDGKCRVYCWRTRKLIANVGRGRVPCSAPDSKPGRLFHDDTLKTFFRRLAWSPDGLLLAVPSGIIETENNGKPKNVTWIFARPKLSSPVIYYPSFSHASMICRWSPIKYSLRPNEKPVFNLPYRFILAIATKSYIILYDTQHAVPIGLISNIHYTKLTDMAWSSDGCFLVASSTDGYCSVVTFAPGELGDTFTEVQAIK